MIVSTIVAPRLASRANRAGGPVTRAASVTARNLVALRRSGYWLVVVAGFFEPVLYLLSIGIGVGSLVRSFTLADGRVVSYAAFVAPAMLAASAMNGALAESTFNFFARLKWQRLYDSMVATPLRPFEIALGELGWAMIRGVLYALAFLGLMIALELTSPGWAVAALFASLLVGVTFGAIGMSVATVLRTWQDFDYLGVAIFALFLFSGTFAPLSSYPAALRIVIECTPLYHAVELIRGLTTGSPSWGTLIHVAYLVALTAVGLTIAGRRMGKILCK
jgi:lipooligosaccharide transport system permease protein